MKSILAGVTKLLKILAGNLPALQFLQACLKKYALTSIAVKIICTQHMQYAQN